MNWIILIACLIVIGVLGILIEVKEFGYFGTGIYVAIIAFIVAIALAVLIPKHYNVEKQNLNSFIKQKEYLENHVSKNEIEDAALTQEKLKCNRWLYDAQFSKKRYGNWSTFSDKVMKLKEIE